LADLVGLTSIKQFTYRGEGEEFSNKYHFTGDIPADESEWRALYDALVVVEKAILPSYVYMIRGYGYDSDADDATAVWSVDLNVPPNDPVPGTLSLAASTAAPGDCAVWARWKTDRLNSNGKAIYLRKYFHGAREAGDSGSDQVDQGQVDALNALGLKLMDGSFIDGRTIRSQHFDDEIQGHGSSQWVTTRTLKRRGKRPSP
jgi:hypothetical protein